jgi:hypothetical protein
MPNEPAANLVAGYVALDVLIDQDLVAVRIFQRQVSRALRFACVDFSAQRDSRSFQVLLDVANIGETRQCLGVAVPAGVDMP